jgi:hypothetical protein
LSLSFAGINPRGISVNNFLHNLKVLQVSAVRAAMALVNAAVAEIMPLEE